jgi:hypothetical protein
MAITHVVSLAAPISYQPSANDYLSAVAVAIEGGPVRRSLSTRRSFMRRLVVRRWTCPPELSGNRGEGGSTFQNLLVYYFDLLSDDVTGETVDRHIGGQSQI